MMLLKLTELSMKNSGFNRYMVEYNDGIFGFRYLENEGIWAELKKLDDKIFIKTSYNPPALYYYKDNNNWILTGSLDNMIDQLNNIDVKIVPNINYYSKNHSIKQLNTDFCETIIKGVYLTPLGHDIVLTKDNIKFVKNDFKYYELPFNEHVIDKWRNKYIELFKTLKNVNLSLSAGQDSRLLFAMFMESNNDDYVIVNKIGRHLIETDVSELVMNYKNIPEDRRIRTSAERKCTISGFATESIREANKLNKIGNISYHRLTLNRKYTSKYEIDNECIRILPFIDSDLSSMRLDYIGQIHEYLYNKYYKDYLNIPFFASSSPNRYFYNGLEGFYNRSVQKQYLRNEINPETKSRNSLEDVLKG